MGLPLSGLRAKDRDVAPHLAVAGVAGSSGRLTQPALTGIVGRREPREPPTKKKAGEEDWRRGEASAAFDSLFSALNTFTGSDPRKNREDRVYWCLLFSIVYLPWHGR